MASRRYFLQAGSSALALGLMACGGSNNQSAVGAIPESNNTEPLSLGTSGTDSQLLAPPAEIHFLKRTSWGPRQADVEHFNNIGRAAWLDEQFTMSPAEEAELEAEINFRWPTVNYSGCKLAQLKDDGRVMRELRQATLFRRIFSRRQLHEVMVDFWTDHFTIYHGDGIARHMKTVDDREVIRANALGNFKTMLKASARSPAMLEFLDNRRSSKNSPNENYARELLELHTLGVSGGYTEEDIANTARAFTGWTIQNQEDDQLCLTDSHRSFLFDAGRHDQEAKMVLGHSLAAGRGIEDGDDVLSILVEHLATRDFIARKLYRRFVSDSAPSDALIESITTAWGRDGDITAMLLVLLNSPEFLSAQDDKLSRPQESAIALVRSLEPTMDGDISLSDLLNAAAIPDLYSMSGLANIDALPKVDFKQLEPLNIDLSESYEGPNTEAMISRAGHVPFQWPSPDGYPDDENFWASVNGLLERWRFAIQVAGQKRADGLSNAAWAASQAEDREVALDNIRQRLLKRDVDEGLRSRILSTAGIKANGEPNNDEQFWRRAMALLIISPYAQRR
jgi:uncharacterized protein (DUF1800 family)